MKNTETNTENEKIVPLNEDLKSHKQDNGSFEKAMNAQKNIKEQMKKEGK